MYSSNHLNKSARAPAFIPNCYPRLGLSKDDYNSYINRDEELHDKISPALARLAVPSLCHSDSSHSR